MILDLLCNDGSPIGVIPADIEGRGVGGAELAMMSLCSTLARRGHTVRVYNDPTQPGEHDGVFYLPLAAYENRLPRDAIIIYRSPNKRYDPRHMAPKVKKVWWSTDQYTIGDFRALAYLVDYVVTISDYHTKYHRDRYGIGAEKIGHIDLGVRVGEYQRAPVDRVQNSLLFCSIPDRGLRVLHAAWPLIQTVVPDATLTITSDYRLWGVDARNAEHRLMWAEHRGVSFLGKVARSQLVQIQMASEIMSYPCTYEELFCISAAECQVAGALPVTSGAGALPTTNEWGILILGEPTEPDFVKRFVERITSLLTKERDYLEKRRETMRLLAARRFDWDVIAARWEKVLTEGRL